MSWKPGSLWTEHGSDWAEDGLKAIHALSYAEWSRRVPNVLRTRYSDTKKSNPDDITERMSANDQEWLFIEASDERLIFRALLDACPGVKKVILDVTDLIDGGWLDERARLCEAARSPEAMTRPIFEPTVILGEGTSDIHVLKLSLAALYPHLADYFGFFNHAELNVDGGTTYLVKFLQAFGAARISSRMVVLFDNDTAGLEALKRAQALKLPSNIKVLRLPDIKLARKYPTVGPQGTRIVNVNGTAASVELYLGRQNLIGRDGRLFPIRWRGYVDKMKAYQGEIEGKADILRRFEKDLKQQKTPAAARKAFPELVAVWELVFGVLR